MEGLDLRWMKAYLKPLEGLTVTKVTLDEEDFPVITLKVPKGHTWVNDNGETCKWGDKEIEISVSCDEEGNGPGFLFGLPMPKLKEKKCHCLAQNM